MHGQTALFYAARYDQLAICKLFSKHGCNMLHQDKNRVKASHFAKIEGHQSIVEFLNTFKFEKKIKEEKSARDSSMNEKKKKK